MGKTEAYFPKKIKPTQRFVFYLRGWLLAASSSWETKMKILRQGSGDVPLSQTHLNVLNKSVWVTVATLFAWMMMMMIQDLYGVRGKL